MKTLLTVSCVSGICRVENRFKKESSLFKGGFFCIAELSCTVVRSFIHLWFDFVLHATHIS